MGWVVGVVLAWRGNSAVVASDCISALLRAYIVGVGLKGAKDISEALAGKFDFSLWIGVYHYPFLRVFYYLVNINSNIFGK